MVRFFMAFAALACLLHAGSPRLLEFDEILALPPNLDNGDDDRTIDEVIAAGAADSAKAATEQGAILVDMDMVVTPEQYGRFFDDDGNGKHTAFAGAGLRDEKTRWPKAIIPYAFESDFREYEKNVYSAMKEWMEKTCVRFTPRGSALHREAGHSHYLRINGAGRGCSTHLGYGGYSAFVSLSIAGGCATHGTSLHELGHSLGLAHEQQRIDRDKYLKVYMENVVDGHEHNFVLDRNTASFGIPYDYCSIMHYGPYSFSKYQISRPTMLARDPNYQFAIGKPNSRKGLSFYDAKIINTMYKCNSKCPKAPRCKDPCYVNHKCECECPVKSPCEKKPCQDYQSQEVCEDFRRRGMCGRMDYIQHWCAKTCGVCEKFKKLLGSDAIATVDKVLPPVIPPTRPSVVIQNKPGPKCKEDSGCKWFASKSACTSAEMMHTCPKSCGVCKNCGDKEVFCPDFAAVGKCESDVKFMLETCNFSCGYCI